MNINPSNSLVPGKPWLTTPDAVAKSLVLAHPTYRGAATISCAPELLNHPELQNQAFATIYDRTDSQDFLRACMQRTFALPANNELPRFPDGIYDLDSLSELERFLAQHPPRFRSSGTPEKTTHPILGASVVPLPMSGTSPSQSVTAPSSASPASHSMDCNS